jgi:ADP-ribosylglycohydrolase
MTVMLRERILGGLWGALVGDALGVPVEFVPRSDLQREPVVGMRGFGTHNQPPGSWSDDSSLLLCTVESLLQGFNTPDLASYFVRWLNERHWTPWGQVFDVGNTTQAAIHNLARGIDPEKAGLDHEGSNGNGSLMRILPVALRFAGSSSLELVSYAHRSSSLTHRHPRCQMACGLYCLLAQALLTGAEPAQAYQHAVQVSLNAYGELPYSKELPHFQRVLSGRIGQLPEDEVSADVYVIHTLEASIWCLLNTRSFSEAVLTAVNLGDDTDTTATVTGGLAGIHYRLSTVPEEWLRQLARREEISRLFENFYPEGTETEEPGSGQG